MQSDTGGYVVAAARADSILDGVYYRALHLTKDSTVGGVMPRAVYGQIADLRVVEPGGVRGMSAGERAVLVWWQLGPSCDRFVPRQAIEAEPGEELFIAAPVLRPRAEWISGLPTFDVEVVHRLYGVIYSPSLARQGLPNNDVAAMSAREYAEFYVRLPVRSLFDRNTAAALDQIIRWADANTELSRKHPAAENVSSARMTRSSMRTN